MDFILLKWWWHIRQTDKTSVSIADNPDIKISKMIPSDYLNEFFIPGASISRSSFHSPYSSLLEYFPPPFPFDKRPNEKELRKGEEYRPGALHYLQLSDHMAFQSRPLFQNAALWLARRMHMQVLRSSYLRRSEIQSRLQRRRRHPKSASWWQMQSRSNNKGE